MTKNAKTISLATISAVVIVLAVFFGRDMALRFGRVHDCGDGPRPTIDMRDFVNQYSAYSVELEASIKDKAKLSTKLAPVQLQQLSEASQHANEFRKYVVAGYNSCAVTKTQYLQVGKKFQVLDSLAVQINQLAANPSLSPEQSKGLASLIAEYAELSRKLGTD